MPHLQNYAATCKAYHWCDAVQGLSGLPGGKCTLGIDSFDALQFIIALNEKLVIEIQEQDYGKTRTLEQLIAFIKTKEKL